MGLTLVTAPTQEPLSLEEAKDHLRETSSAQDGLIAGYILSAREFIENATRRKFMTQTLDYTVDFNWPCDFLNGQRIEIPLSQAASITSVSYVDTAGASQTLAASQYYTVLNDDSPRILPAYGVVWPDVYCKPAAVTVRFVAGTALSSVPHSLLQAMRMMISHWYANREAVNVGNTINEFPLGVEALLSPYRYGRAA